MTRPNAQGEQYWEGKENEGWLDLEEGELANLEDKKAGEKL